MEEKRKSRTNVRSLILQFENLDSNMNRFSKSLSSLPKQTKSTKRLFSLDSSDVSVTKSVEIKRPVILKLEELKHIRDDVQEMQKKLNHAPGNLIKNVEYQNEIMFCLIELAMLESDGNQKVKNEKQNLIKILQNCQFGITKFFMKEHSKNDTSTQYSNAGFTNFRGSSKIETKAERNSPEFLAPPIEYKVRTLKNLFEGKSKFSGTKIVPNFKVEKKINLHAYSGNSNNDSDSERSGHRESIFTLDDNNNFESEIVSDSSCEELGYLSDSEYDSILTRHDHDAIA